MSKNVLMNLFFNQDDTTILKKFKDDLKTELETYGDVKKIMIYVSFTIPLKIVLKAFGKLNVLFLKGA